MRSSCARQRPDRRQTKRPAMLPQFQEHASYIYAAYGLAALTLCVLVVSIIARARAAKSRLERLRRQAEHEGPEQ